MAVPLTGLIHLATTEEPDGFDVRTALGALREERPVLVPTMDDAFALLRTIGLDDDEIQDVFDRVPLGSGTTEAPDATVAPMRVTGTVEGEPYAVDLIDGDAWPADRRAGSVKAAALVLAQPGLAAEVKSAVALLAEQTQIDRDISEVKAAHEGFVALLESKAFGMPEPRDDKGRWIALQGAIASAKVAARRLLRVPGVAHDTGLETHLATASGAARVHDHPGAYRALREADSALNRMGPAVLSRTFGADGMPKQHPALLDVGHALEAAFQAHADLTPKTPAALASVSALKTEMDDLLGFEVKAWSSG